MWNVEQTEFLLKWWPHFGSDYVAKHLGFQNLRVRRKVKKLKLKRLPKLERLCMTCKVGFQRPERNRCNACLQAERKTELKTEHLLDKESFFKRWIGKATNRIRKRDKNCDITKDFMIQLWEKQQGRCYYSNLPIHTPVYGSGIMMFSPSIDRIDSNKGYTKDNVVWTIWACNAGKSTMSIQEYINICQSVVNYRDSNGNIK